MKVLGIIPARGGSKGIKNKNIVPILGKPLLAYTVEPAKASKRLTRVVLSTDDEEIAKVGRSLGLDVPFMRPPELARDDTPTLPVLQDVVRRLEAAGEHYDAICLLQPTNPLRTVEIIDGCLELFESSNADSVITVLSIPHKYNPHWAFEPTADGSLRLATGEATIIPRRQELPAAYHREGSVYVTKTEVLMQGNSLYGKRIFGFPVDEKNSVNIDGPEDLALAENLLRTQISK
jgi:CMP-N,N'-diacetyllegionaminic acid synthase